MPKSIQTTGDRGMDQEYDLLWAAIAALQKAQSTATGTNTTTTVVQSSASGTLTVQNVAGSVSVAAELLEFDEAAGLSVTPVPGGAKVSRTAAAGTPVALGTAAAGTSIIAANQDHVHPTTGLLKSSVGGTITAKGTAVLVAGTVTVNTAAATNTAIILLTAQNNGGTVGSLSVSARVAATSFTVLSTNVLDTSTVGYLIFEP